jgi:hypothetical protein
MCTTGKNVGEVSTLFLDCNVVCSFATRLVLAIFCPLPAVSILGEEAQALYDALFVC